MFLPLKSAARGRKAFIFYGYVRNLTDPPKIVRDRLPGVKRYSTGMAGMHSPSAPAHAAKMLKRTETTHAIRDADEIVKETVLVTGANGCVGQHIVSLLSKHEARNLEKIKVADIEPFVGKLELNPVVPIEKLQVDLRNIKDVQAAMEGVTTVIHAASLISLGPFADVASMERTNVQGTKNVVDSCKKFGVERLVYTSTLEVAIGSAPIYGGREDDVAVPPSDGKFLMGNEYPRTKYLAERYVLTKNEKTDKQDSKKLSTLALRLTLQYGEEDNHVIATALRRASKRTGKQPKLNLRNDLLQATYVGNSAWAHICALRALRNHPEDCSGKAYFITDDTKLQPTFDFITNYMRPCGFEYYEFGIPFNLAYSVVCIQELAAKALRPWKQLNVLDTRHGLKFLNHIHIFDSSLAKEKLGYSPIYDPETSMKNSINFYVRFAKELRQEQQQQ